MGLILDAPVTLALNLRIFPEFGLPMVVIDTVYQEVADVART